MCGLCRSCLELASKTYPLIGKIANVDVNVIDMLEYCTSEKLDLNDDLPKDVCIPCFKSIRITYNFLKQFKEAQLKLQKQLQLKNLVTSDNNKEYQLLQTTPTTDQSSIHYDLDSIHNYALKLGNFISTQDAELTDYPQIIEVFTEDNNIEASSSDDQFKLKTKDPLLEDAKFVHICNLIKEEPTGDLAEQNEINYIEFNSDSAEIEQLEQQNSEIGYMMLKSSVKPVVIKLEKKDIAMHPTTVSYRCPLCKVRLQNCQKFTSHIYSHRMKTIVCTWCPSKAHIPIEEYLYHYKQIHKYQCNICEKSLTSSYGYRYHMKQHESVKNYKCPMENCPKSFLLFNLLKRHIVEKHSETKKYKCDKCDTAYSSYDTFRYHKKTHEGVKTHLCTVCGRGFYQAVHLRDHMYRHLGKKMFTCDLCGFSVVTNSQLKKHQRFCSTKSGSNKIVID